MIVSTMRLPYRRFQLVVTTSTAQHAQAEHAEVAEFSSTPRGLHALHGAVSCFRAFVLSCLFVFSCFRASEVDGGGVTEHDGAIDRQRPAGLHQLVVALL